MNSRKVGSVLLLILKIACVGTAAVLLLFYLNSWYKKDSSHFNHELDKFYSIQDHEPFMITNVGSSHGDYGFDYSSLESSGWKCFNFGMPSQTYEYDLALLKQYSDHFAEGGIMFIPVSYFSFNDETVTDAEKEASEVRYYQVLSPENNPDYSWFKDLTTNRLPILTGYSKNLTTYQDIYKQEHDGARLDDLLSPLQLFSALPVQAAGEDAAAAGTTAADTAVSDAGTADSAAETSDAAAGTSAGTDTGTAAAIPSTGKALQAYIENLVGPTTVERYKKLGEERYHRHFDGKADYFEQERIDQLKEIIAFCKSKKITPVLVTTPYMVYYTEYIDDSFWNQFYATIDRICQEEQVQYYDYGRDDRFQYTFGYFADGDHLNDAGRTYFLQCLETDVPAFTELLSNGPDSLKK